MKAISDASSLIILAKAELLKILPLLYSPVLIPQAVLDEIYRGPSGDPLRGIIDSLDWLEIVSVEPPLTPMASIQLGPGETEVIEWARQHRDVIALLDDRAARRIAVMLGIRITGTLGLIALAARKRIIPSFQNAIDKIKDAGLFIDDKLIKEIAKSLYIKIN